MDLCDNLSRLSAFVRQIQDDTRKLQCMLAETFSAERVDATPQPLLEIYEAILLGKNEVRFLVPDQDIPDKEKFLLEFHADPDHLANATDPLIEGESLELWNQLKSIDLFTLFSLDEQDDRGVYISPVVHIKAMW